MIRRSVFRQPWCTFSHARVSPVSPATMTHFPPIRIPFPYAETASPRLYSTASETLDSDPKAEAPPPNLSSESAQAPEEESFEKRVEAKDRELIELKVG